MKKIIRNFKFKNFPQKMDRIQIKNLEVCQF